MTSSTIASPVLTGTWQGDGVHSDISFTVPYLAGTFKGSFTKFAATLTDGSLSGSAEVTSIQTKDENLNTHLLSPEFFDAERFPTFSFRSDELQITGEEVSVPGEITIKGETQPITLNGTITEPITDPYGNERLGLTLSGEIDRTMFGIDWNTPLPSGEQALDNTVTLVAELQFVQAAATDQN